MLYNTGTIAINGNTATGTGTNWTAPASQIRVSQTIIVLSNPVQMFQITAINSGTSLTVTPAASPALSGQKYGILVTDSLSVDGLAQSMSQLINEYDENIGAWETFASTSANQLVTVTINGTSLSIPAIGGLARKGANSDITELKGLTTALSIAQGGTGAKTAAEARKNLELVDSSGLIPISMGGTGAKNDTDARKNIKAVGIDNTEEITGLKTFTSKITAYGINEGFTTSANYPGIVLRDYNLGDVIGKRIGLEQKDGTLYVWRRGDNLTTGATTVYFPNTSGAIALQGTSGLKYKEDITEADLNEAVNRVMSLKMVNFKYIDDEQHRIRFGIIAEDSELIAPQYIKHNREIDPNAEYNDNELDEEGLPYNPVYRDRPSVDTNPIVMDLLGVVQFQQKELEELRALIQSIGEK
ncbi:TPA: tail fiber domain-containing protein [Escherichia coli]|uniref:tail fiber domain-containing protein n=1 Tax=Escherichia coli TaxID=562 RepID=UPI001A02B089|nr:tail fiber domain-containing protein [Escherichia coli]EGO4140622.1 tail fiber domain-containing protein [Escherichia coli]EJF1597843.1 tail fiber domain-containing protein [Escherichia coli]HCX7442783.1 tail fiber domain-containing protein [Escherichia coli]HCX7446211.1 tail fiber domain-containing protein [Escherichia coli]